MPKRLLKTKEVLEMIGMGSTKFYRIIKDETEDFPKPVITGHTNLYDIEDINAWIDAKKSAHAA